MIIFTKICKKIREVNMIRGHALALDNILMDTESSTHYTPTAYRILLVEDNKSDVLLIQKMLQDVTIVGNNYEFSDVPRMDDALELLQSTTFDLILLDLHLCDIEGVSAVAALRGSVPQIPIIVYSGTNDPKLKQEALMCGARHYLVKGHESPFSLRFMIQETLAYA